MPSFWDRLLERGRMVNTEPPGRPLYRARGGELVFAHPAVGRGAKAYGFAIRADLRALQRLLDNLFNEPAGGAVRYQAIAPYVLLACIDTDAISSLDPSAASIGSVSEIDVSFWVPAVGLKRVASAWVPDRLVWFPAYVFVSDIYALAAGRELYGFPKTIGWFTMPKSPAEADRFTVEAPAIKTFGAAARVERRPVLEIARAANTTSTTSAARAEGEGTSDRGIDAVADRLSRLLVDGEGDLGSPAEGVVRAALQKLRPKTFRVLLLKQIRDIVDCSRACYQAIIESPMEIARLRGGGLLPGDFELTLFHLDSHPIARELGLGEGGDTLVVPAALAFHADMDFTLGLGDEVWKAPSAQ